MDTTIRELLCRRLEAIGGDAASLRHQLAQVGARVSRQTVHQWLTDDTKPPGRGNLKACIDVLCVPVDARPMWWRTAGYEDVLESLNGRPPAPEDDDLAGAA